MQDERTICYLQPWLTSWLILRKGRLMPSADFATHVCRLDSHRTYPDIK
jgi:hypothetical protein